MMSSADPVGATTGQEISISEEQLHALWQHAPFAVWVHLDLRLIYINPFGVRTLGAKTAQEVLGRSPADFVTDEDRAEILRRQRQTVNRGATIREGILHFRRLDGSVFASHEFVWPIVVDGRRAVQASFSDVSMLTETQAALSNSLSTQWQIVESLPQLVWTTLPDGRHDYFNQRWYDYTGTRPGETDGSAWAELLHPDDFKRTWDHWLHCLETGEDYNIEYRLRGADGNYRWFIARAHPLRDADGAIARWFGTLTDIDKQRRSEERLRETEARFRTAAQAVSDILWTNNAIGEMWGEQPGWAAFTGQTPEEYQGYGWADAVLPEDAQPTIEAWNEAVQAREMFVFEHHVRRYDGVWRLFSIRALPVLDEQGNVREWVGVHRDITERRAYLDEIQRLNGELEERVRRRTAELEASNRELEAFSYSVSHDLRAPLRTIDGFSLALEEDAGPLLNEHCRDYVTRIRQGVQRMGGLIDSLLQLSRVTRAEIQREHLDMSHMAREIATHMLRLCPNRTVELSIEPGLHAYADSRLTQVALENLFGNAVKFTSKRDHARIEFGARRAQRRQEFFIRDNGAGFDMQYAGKLFNAFQRLHGDKDFPGSGIGLATVARVVRRHGGYVRAEGEPEGGATFSFTLD